MGTIKNLELIADMLPDIQLQRMDAGAAMHLHYSKIEFKILEIKDDEITVRVTQGESPAENHLTNRELVSRAKELFNHFLPDKIIHVRAFPYNVPKVDEVSPAWIQNRMTAKSISQKAMADETGIDKTNLSAWINGTRPMSQPVKAMFWFMLR